MKGIIKAGFSFPFSFALGAPITCGIMIALGIDKQLVYATYYTIVGYSIYEFTKS